MTRIFISYSRHNRDTADFFAAELRRRGVDVFIDYQRLEAGESFSERLRQEVVACDVFLLMVSGHSAESQWVLAETDLAHELKKRIIPVMLEPFDMVNSPFWYLLRVERIYWAEGRDSAIAKLMRSLGLSNMREYLPFEPETVLIPVGPFIMGSTAEHVEELKAQDDWDWPEKTETRQRRIILPEYHIGKYPVTVGQYRAFVEEGGYHEKKWWTAAGWRQCKKEKRMKPHFWDDLKWTWDDRLPVVGISWYEAHAYCQWLAAVTKRPYRLPSEAEWEKAARGTDGRIWPWGNEWREGRCNSYEAGIGHTTPVDQFSPQGDSSYGASDMVGNVGEWCASKWIDKYRFKEADEAAGESWRALRSGSWSGGKNFVRAAVRYGELPTYASYYVGFRCSLPALE